ncbi:hypothetical protein ACFL6G_02360 [candidate division KSB1 bacterium]
MSSSELYNYAGSSHYWDAVDLKKYFEETFSGIFGEKLLRLRIYKAGKLITGDTEKIEKSDGMDLSFELILRKSVDNLSDKEKAAFYGWIASLNDTVRSASFSGTPDFNITSYEKDNKCLLLSFKFQ